MPTKNVWISGNPARRPGDIGIDRNDGRLYYAPEANSAVPVFTDERPGTTYFVDANSGLATNSGRSWDQALLTMTSAFDKLVSGDRIYFRGRIREQLTTPVQIFDVGIFGVSHNTRHPDSTPANGELIPARWDAPASPTASTPLLDILQQGWRVSNVLFTGSSSDTVDCIRLFRDGGSSDDERDASHAVIDNCRFQGGRYGIVDSGGCARVRILDNEFLLFSTSGNRAITNVTGAGIGTMWGWIIEGNEFHGNLTDIDIAAAGPRILGNHFRLNSLGVTNTVAIDITGGSEELVAKNFMYCASDEASVVNARFVASSTPSWGPNYYTDVEEYGEPAE